MPRVGVSILSHSQDRNRVRPPPPKSAIGAQLLSHRNEIDAAGGDLSKIEAACKRFNELEGYLYSNIRSLTDYGRACRHEAMRDLVRARAAAFEMLCVHRQQVSAFLLRHGRIFPRKTAWGARQLRWLQRQTFDHPAHQIALQEMVEAVRISKECVKLLAFSVQTHSQPEGDGGGEASHLLHACGSLRVASIVVLKQAAAAWEIST